MTAVGPPNSLLIDRGWTPPNSLLIDRDVIPAFVKAACWRDSSKFVRHGRYVTFRLAEVAISRALFAYLIAIGLIGEPTALVTGSGGPQKKNS